MISKKDAKFLEAIITKLNKNSLKSSNNYPLLEKGFSNEDIMSGIEVLLSVFD